MESFSLTFDYMRIWFDFPPLVAVVAGGGYEVLTVFRRCAAPEKIRIVRTEGSNSGVLKAGKKWQQSGKKNQVLKRKAEKS